jgi:hypothetical protein
VALLLPVFVKTASASKSSYSTTSNEVELGCREVELGLQNYGMSSKRDIITSH